MVRKLNVIELSVQKKKMTFYLVIWDFTTEKFAKFYIIFNT